MATAQRQCTRPPYAPALSGRSQFALYHLHVPWVIPSTLVDGIFLLAYPTRRFQSAWMGIIVHSSQSVFLLIIVLALVLD